MILFLPFEKQLQTRHSNPESLDERKKEWPGNEANQRRHRYFWGIWAIWTFADGHFLPTFPIFVSPPLRSDSHTTSLAVDFRAWVKSLAATTGKLFSTQPSLFPGLSETCFSVKTSVQVFCHFFRWNKGWKTQIFFPTRYIQLHCLESFLTLEYIFLQWLKIWRIRNGMSKNFLGFELRNLLILNHWV